MTAGVRLSAAGAAALATAVLTDDSEAFAQLLADPDLTLPGLLEQAGTLLRVAAGWELGAAGLPFGAPAVAGLWAQHGAAVGWELAARMGRAADDLAGPLAWLGDVMAGQGGYVPACDQALHLACALQALALLWARPLADWRTFCAALAAADSSAA